MPKLIKGSVEAIAWSKKMSEAKQAKKQQKIDGGFLFPTADYNDTFSKTDIIDITDTNKNSPEQCCSVDGGDLKTDIKKISRKAKKISKDYLIPLAADVAPAVLSGLAGVSATALSGNPVAGILAAAATEQAAKAAVKSLKIRSQKSATLKSVAKPLSKAIVKSVGTGCDCEDEAIVKVKKPRVRKQKVNIII